VWLSRSRKYLLIINMDKASKPGSWKNDVSFCLNLHIFGHFWVQKRYFLHIILFVTYCLYYYIVCEGVPCYFLVNNSQKILIILLIIVDFTHWFSFESAIYSKHWKEKNIQKVLSLLLRSVQDLYALRLPALSQALHIAFDYIHDNCQRNYCHKGHSKYKLLLFIVIINL